MPGISGLSRQVVSIYSDIGGLTLQWCSMYYVSCARELS